MSYMWGVYLCPPMPNPMPDLRTERVMNVSSVVSI